MPQVAECCDRRESLARVIPVISVSRWSCCSFRSGFSGLYPEEAKSANEPPVARLPMSAYHNKLINEADVEISKVSDGKLRYWSIVRPKCDQSVPGHSDEHSQSGAGRDKWTLKNTFSFKLANDYPQ